MKIKKEEYRNKIKQRISEGIDKYKSTPDILIKYKWLETKYMNILIAANVNIHS